MARGTNVTNQKRQYDTAHEGEFAEEIRTRFRKIHDLRYGENPNQHAAIYHSAYDSLVEKVTLDEVKSAKGGLSATNYMDIMRGMDLLKYFDRQAVAVMKHAIPSGFSVILTGFCGLLYAL